jgi:hypothetical protein
MTVLSFGADSAMCAAILLVHVSLSTNGKDVELLGDRFWSYTKPGIFGHPDALIILLPDLEALVPVSALHQS